MKSLVQAIIQPSDSSVRSPDKWDNFEKFWRNDVAVYLTDGERAAYRAGLSLAASICDLVAVDFGSAKRPTKKSSARFTVAQICGDRIWGIYQQIRCNGDRDTEAKDAGVSLNQTKARGESSP